MGGTEMGKPYPKKRSPKRPLVLRSCKVCGAEFYAKQSNIDAGGGIFCGCKCRNVGRKARSDRQPRSPQVCKWCGKAFIDDHAVRERVYCSRKCLGLSQRKDNRQHPRRKQGSALLRWARAVILRDKACMRCGTTEKLQSHHVDSYKDNPERRLDVSNGIALCPPCHHSQHSKGSLQWFLQRGGRSVSRCVVCEQPYVGNKPGQRTCSPKCGRKLRYREED